MQLSYKTMYRYEISNLINVLLIIFRNLIILINSVINNYNKEENINELEIILKELSFSDMKSIFSCEASRRNLYNSGVENGIKYYNALFKNSTKWS